LNTTSLPRLVLSVLALTACSACLLAQAPSLPTPAQVTQAAPPPLLPAATSILYTYGNGDPFLHDGGGGLKFYVNGQIDTGTEIIPLAFEGRIFLPPSWRSLMPMRLVVIGHGNHGVIDDVGWYVKMLERNGMPDSAYVAPTLTHGTSGGSPWGHGGASDANGWRMLLAAGAAAQFPGLIDTNRVVGFGYSLGAAANVGTMCMAGKWGVFSVFRGGASMGVGIWDGVWDWPQTSQAQGIVAPQYLLNAQYDQYIRTWMALALTSSLTSRNISASLREYQGIDHFTLPSLPQAWADAANALVSMSP
jgi:hypothetical protein